MAAAIAFSQGSLSASSSGTPWRAVEPHTPTRMQSSLSTEPLLATLGVGPSGVLSPDGSRAVFVARAENGPPVARLYLRRLDELQATPLNGTEGADDEGDRHA